MFQYYTFESPTIYCLQEIEVVPMLSTLRMYHLSYFQTWLCKGMVSNSGKLRNISTPQLRKYATTSDLLITL